MKLSKPQTPAISDIPEAPDDVAWVDEYQSPRDNQMEDISKILRKRWSPEDNANFELRDIRVTHESPIDISLQTLLGAPRGVEHWYNSAFDYCDLKWEPLDVDRVRVTCKFDTAPTEAVLVRLAFWGA